MSTFRIVIIPINNRAKAMKIAFAFFFFSCGKEKKPVCSPRSVGGSDRDTFFKRKFEKLDNKFRRSGRGFHKRGYPCLIQGKEVPEKEYRLYIKTGKLPSEFK
jgi:hypothetical protein